MKGVFKIIFLSLVVVASLMVLTVDPVHAEESRHATGEKSVGDDQHDHDKFRDDDSAIPREGYDERVHCICRAPVSFSEFPGLTIDNALLTATPHWMFLAAGEKEQQGILQYLNNADISAKKRTEWKRFLKGIWNKYPVRYVKTKSSAVLKIGDPHTKYSLTARENATFREIEAYIAQDMEKIRQNIVMPMWARPSHAAFAKNAIIQVGIVNKDEQYYSSLVDGWAREPDGWYENDPIPYALQINHGFVPVGITMLPFPFIVLPPQIAGVGLAPDNYGKYTSLAKQEFASREYDNAFKDLAYASHFISDLGNPYHTPMVQIIPLQFVDSPYSLILFPNTEMILNYELLHDNYENYVQTNFPSLGTTSESYVSLDPIFSAKGHAVFSWAMSYPLIYSCYWHYIINRDFTFESNPAIVSLTQNRVMETAKHNNGLVQYVTGGKPITFTITAMSGQGGSISPSSPVTINYGQSQTYTMQPAPDYVIEDVKVNGESKGQLSQFTFDTDTLNKAKGDQTIEATFQSTAPPQGIVPLCQAGTPFDSSRYPQDWPQSDPMVFQCSWDGTGQVYISGDKSSLIGVVADDGFTITIEPSGKTFDALPHYACQHNILELTDGMTPGVNTFTLVVQNWMKLSMSYAGPNGGAITIWQTPYIIQVNSPEGDVSAGQILTETTPSAQDELIQNESVSDEHGTTVELTA